ncbi:MAG: N-acetyltransferase family protein [Bacteroidota bacterium]
MSLSIERATPDQAGTLTAITFAGTRQLGFPESQIAVWPDELTVTPDYVVEYDVWSALLENQVVGYYALRYLAWGADLESLYVSPDFIRRGIGRTLFHHAVSRCRENGCRSLDIASEAKTVGFYEKVGAAVYGEWTGAPINGVPRTLVFLWLEL